MSSTVSIVWLKGPKNTKFFTRFYKASPPKAAIVFIHGFGEHCTRYVEFHTKLADDGISIFAYDQRGFGNTGQDVKERSKGSKYGRTRWKRQMEDLDWAVKHVQKELRNVPVYIMGHSMGGGEVLGFASEGESSPYASTVASLAGVLALSPLVQITTPVSPVLRRMVATIKLAFPYAIFTGDHVPDELSRDKSIGQAYIIDPLVKSAGSFRAIHEMLAHGDKLKKNGWKNWPKKLPVIILHGTADKVTCPIASKGFYDNLTIDTKKYVAAEGALHELFKELPEVQEQLFHEVTLFIEETRVPNE